MSKKYSTEAKSPVLDQQVAPPAPVVNVPPLVATAAKQGGRDLKPGVRPNSPRALLHLPSVFA